MKEKNGKEKFSLNVLSVSKNIQKYNNWRSVFYRRVLIRLYKEKSYTTTDPDEDPDED